MLLFPSPNLSTHSLARWEAGAPPAPVPGLSQTCRSFAGMGWQGEVGRGHLWTALRQWEESRRFWGLGRPASELCLISHRQRNPKAAFPPVTENSRSGPSWSSLQGPESCRRPHQVGGLLPANICPPLSLYPSLGQQMA